MKRMLALLALFALALTTRAAWTVTSDGSNPRVTDGHWVLQLTDQYKAKYISTDGATTVLDMTTLNSDLAAAGKTYVCTEIDANGFQISSMTELLLPDEVSAFGLQCFKSCTALTKLELGTGFAEFKGSSVFRNCKALSTVYTRGETPVVGTVRLPDAVTSLPEGTFAYCNAVLHHVARGVKSIDSATFLENNLCQSIELSPELYSITAGGNNDQGAVYRCWALTSFSPSNMALTVDVGKGSFREVRLGHGLDFSQSTFTAIEDSGFFSTSIPNACRITLPATLAVLGTSALHQKMSSASLLRMRFLGEVPASLAVDCLAPRNAGSHNVIYVDANKCPTWTASGFTSVSDDPSMINDASYPGTNTLGKTTLGVNQNGWWNWLVQEDLPKGEVYWEVAGTDQNGVVTIESVDGFWTLSLTPNGSGAYIARCESCAAVNPMKLDLGQIEDDTGLPLAGLADSAFANCAKLSEVKIPTGANALGANAFKGCTALAKVTLPSTFDWSAVGASAFEGCSALSQLGLASQFVAAGALVLPGNVTGISEALFAGCSSLSSVAASGLASVPARAFDGCSSLASASFAVGIGKLESIGAAAFRGTALTQTMDFTGSTLTAIPASLFENCAGISLVKLPAALASVGDNAFSGMAPGASIAFAGAVPTLGANALQPPADAAGSRYIVRVEYSNLAAWCSSGFTALTPAMQQESDYIDPMRGRSTLGTDGSASNWIFSLNPSLTWWISGHGTFDNTSTTIATDGENEVHVYTKNGISNLAPKQLALDGVLDMTTLNWDTGLAPTGIPNRGFQYNGDLVEIRLPDSITALSQECFQYATNLTAVELGANFASFGPRHAFSQCTALNTLWKRGDTRVEGQYRIPEGITDIPNYTFENNDAVLDVYAPGVVSLGTSSFYASDALTNAVFSPNLHTLAGGGNNSGVFYMCGNLRTISPSEMRLQTLGNDVFRELRLSHGLDFSKSTFNTIGTRAFFGFKCSGANGKPLPITFPATLTTVNESAFRGYNGGGQIYVFLGDKPTFGNDALNPLSNDPGRRLFIVADVRRFPAWVESDITPLAEADYSAADYPSTYLSDVPGYPGAGVYGWITTKSGNFKNWLVPLKDFGTLLIIK